MQLSSITRTSDADGEGPTDVSHLCRLTHACSSFALVLSLVPDKMLAHLFRNVCPRQVVHDVKRSWCAISADA